MQTTTTKRLLVSVLVLQGLTLAGQWVGSAWTSPAIAQIPDAGMQRIEMLNEAKATNAKLDRLIEILESGKLQVRTQQPDDKKDAK